MNSKKKSRRRKQRRSRNLNKQGRSGHRPRNRYLAPRTVEQYFAMPEKTQVTWNQVTHVVTRMRTANVSLTRASREFGLSPRKVVRLAKSALRKRLSGRYVARDTDKLLRILMLPTPEGLREIGTSNSREASKAAVYWNAVHRYLDTGDSNAIRQFTDENLLDATGSRVPLLVDLEELDRLGGAGNLRFESIYQR
jgi:hypothetical protein